MSDGFIKSNDWLGARSCPYCARYSVNGHAEDCPWSKTRAEVRDLKARLRAVREGMKDVATIYGLKFHIEPRTVHALDLRRKNWRKP